MGNRQDDLKMATTKGYAKSFFKVIIVFGGIMFVVGQILYVVQKNNYQKTCDSFVGNLTVNAYAVDSRKELGFKGAFVCKYEYSKCKRIMKDKDGFDGVECFTDEIYVDPLNQ